MLQTRFGEKAQEWSSKAKADFKADIDALKVIPPSVLRAFIDQIAKTYPACNVVELATLEAERNAITDAQPLADVGSAFAYILENTDRERPEAVTADLASLELISPDAAEILREMLALASPFREAAKVASSYLRIGAPLFASISGTVDLRLRFHKTEAEFLNRKLPTELAHAQPVVLVNLFLATAGEREDTVSFLMDETDLKYMKRFVTNMERELELARGLTLVQSPENKPRG